MRQRAIRLLMVLIVCCGMMLGCSVQEIPGEQTGQKVETTTDKEESDTQSTKEDAEVVDYSGCKVHFINVGQGDSILIECDDTYMLIDAGENDQGAVVVSYLKQLGVTGLEYVIGTHPHSDHIGGLDTVIDAFDVETVIMPEVEHTTVTYEDVLIAISEKGLSITTPVVGDEYSLGGAEFTIVAPGSDSYSDLNDYSVGIHLVYGNTSFLLCGDAEEISEKEMLASGIDLKSTVLKLNHHGSQYSNTSAFLNAVDPEFIVISCGTGNSYGHPNVSVLENMQQRGLPVYRTDQLGTIVMTSDGNTVTTDSTPATDEYENSNDTTQAADSTEETDETTKEESFTTQSKGDVVYKTETGTKYHKVGCSYLKGNGIEITIEEAQKEGLEPCSRCYGN